jgi:hypothetical protein
MLEDNPKVGWLTMVDMGVVMVAEAEEVDTTTPVCR